MRVTSWLGIALSAALSAAACGPGGPALTSRELHVHAFSAYVPQALIDAFQTRTGVQVTLTTYDSNEQLLADLEANPATYDLIIPSDYAVEDLIHQGRLQPLDLARIPNRNNITESFLSPYFDPGGVSDARRGGSGRNDKFSLPYLWGTTGILYDPTQVAEPITRWADLWRPELQGHLVVLDDARELIGASLLTLGFSKNATDPAQIAAARDHLLELAPGILAFDSATPERAVLDGSAWAAVVFNGNAALALRDNPQLMYVLPEEGAGIWFDNLAIPSDAPHPDAATAFIDFVLEPEQGATLIRAFPYASPNRAALDWLRDNDRGSYDAYVANPAANPSLDALIGAQPVQRVGAGPAGVYNEAWQIIRTSK